MTPSISRSPSVRRTLLALAFLLAAGSAQAEWYALGRTDTFRLYLDPQTIRVNGDLAQVWQLMDFTVAQWADPQTAIGSIKSLLEYDCAQPRSRTLLAEAYTEQMEAGRKVASERVQDPQWEIVEPTSTAEKIRQMACGKGGK
jgi:hypothetical protein